METEKYFAAFGIVKLISEFGWGWRVPTCRTEYITYFEEKDYSYLVSYFNRLKCMDGKLFGSNDNGERLYCSSVTSNWTYWNKDILRIKMHYVFNKLKCHNFVFSFSSIPIRCRRFRRVSHSSGIVRTNSEFHLIFIMSQIHYM